MDIKSYMEVKCPICNSSHTFLFKKFEKWTLFECSSDGFIFVYPLPSDQEIKDFYNSVEYFNSNSKNRKFGYKDYLKDRKIAERNDKNILSKIKKWFPAPNSLSGLSKQKLLDIGASHGFFMENIRKYGFDVFGNDLSEQAVNYAKKQNLNVRLGNTKEQNYPSNYFDAITILGVIEHFRNINDEMAEIKRILNPGGLLVIQTLSTSNFVGRGAIKPPEHLIYFNEKNMTDFLSSMGFSVLETKTLITYYGLEDFISRSFGRIFNNRNSKLINAAENTLVKLVSYLGLKNASIPFFDGQFLIVAKKQ